MTLKSINCVFIIASVRGMGVAENCSECGRDFVCLESVADSKRFGKFSLFEAIFSRLYRWFVPKRCCSSLITRARSSSSNSR